MQPINRLQQLLEYIRHMLPLYRHRHRLDAQAPVTLSFVANDRPGVVSIQATEELPGASPEGTLFYTNGSLVVALPDGYATVNTYEQAFTSSLIPANTEFLDYFHTFLSARISGPQECRGQDPLTFEVSVSYLTETGVVTFGQVNADWRCTHGTIDAYGVWVPPVTEKEMKALITARVQTESGSTRMASMQVLVHPNIFRYVTGLEVYGPRKMADESTHQYIAAFTYSDGSTETVAPRWEVSADYAQVDATGKLTLGEVPSDSLLTLTARHRSFVTSIGIVVTRRSAASISRSRWGIMRDSGLTQARVDQFTQVGAAGSKTFAIHTQTGVGERLWLLTPFELGPVTVHDVEEGTANAWSEPVVVEFEDRGTPVRWFMRHTLFDNLGRKTWSTT